jgi:hypothetical protein
MSTILVNVPKGTKGALCCHSDSGHGWLAVKRKELARLGILNKVTSYSYQRGATVYLEEDCDLALYVNTKLAKDGDKPVLYYSAYHDGRSQIRGYQRFEYVEGFK